MMRIRHALFAAALAPVLLSSPGHAQGAGGAGECLSEQEIREEVSAKRVVPQLSALRAARAKIGGEAVRARLCRGGEGLVYQITALKRDGKVVRVVVDGASGKVLSPN